MVLCKAYRGIQYSTGKRSRETEHGASTTFYRALSKSKLGAWVQIQDGTDRATGQDRNLVRSTVVARLSSNGYTGCMLVGHLGGHQSINQSGRKKATHAEGSARSSDTLEDLPVNRNSCGSDSNWVGTGRTGGTLSSPKEIIIIKVRAKQIA
jgi:hypothetical protein